MENPTRKLKPWIFAVGAVIVALIAAPLLIRPPNLRQQLAGAHRGIESGELILHIETSDFGLLGDFLVNRGVDVPLRRIGGGDEKLSLRGARIHEMSGGRAAAVAYGGPEATLVVHWIVPDRIAARASGADGEAPEVGSFGEGGLTLIVWHEGSAFHVLSAEMSREKLAAIGGAGFPGSTASFPVCLNGAGHPPVALPIG